MLDALTSNILTSIIEYWKLRESEETKYNGILWNSTFACESNFECDNFQAELKAINHYQHFSNCYLVI